MQGKSPLHGPKTSPGLLATITPTPPAALTLETASATGVRLATDVKQRTTFPATGVLLSKRASQTLQVIESLLKIRMHCVTRYTNMLLYQVLFFF